MYDPDDSIIELDTNKPLVLLLGDIAHEGVLSMLQASHRQYKQKLLKSKPDNWQSIIKYFDQFEIASVLIKLSPDVISRLASEEYQEVGNALLGKISRKPNIIFVYEDLLSGSIDLLNEDWKKYYNQPTKEKLGKVLDWLEKLKLYLVPYKRNAQVTVLAELFLQDTENNLLFRLYVPSGRMWSNEADRLLQLFREYLSTVGHVSVRLDQNRSDKGIVYELHGNKLSCENELSVEFSEFTRFLNLCVNDQSAAEDMLIAKHIKKEEITEILSRYGKESKRLHIDFKHERERKILNIQQRLESELVDAIKGDAEWSAIRAMVESTVPSSGDSDSLLAFKTSSVGNAYPHMPVTININPQIVETVNGIITHEINGDQQLGTQGQELLELINKYGKTTELSSAVYEIEDESASKPSRLKASQRIKKFLLEVSRKGGDITAGVLQTYIENKLGL